jgi:iron(III) transport system permease protein
MTKLNNFDRRYYLLIAAGVFVLLIVVYPLWQLFYRSFFSAAGFSLDNYLKVLSTPVYYRSLFNSIWVALATSLLCMIVGTILAFVLVRTDLPGRGRLKNLLIIAYSIPPFFAAIAWIQLLGPQGFLTRPLLQWFDWSSAPWNIYSAGGIVFVMTTHYFVLVFLTVAAALEQMDASLEEAARASGARTGRIMFGITLPLVLPSIFAGGLLAFIGALANFGIPALLGMRARFFVLTTSIYYALSIPDFPLATALSMMLVVVGMLPLLLQWRIQKNEGRYTVISGKSVHPAEIRLGASRKPLFLGVSIFVSLMSLVPMGSMLVSALLKYWGAPLTPANLTLEHFAYILQLDIARRAIGNSLLLALLAATMTMFVGVVISYLFVKAKLPGSRYLDLLGTVPYAVPHTVTAIAMILAWSPPPASLYGTFWIIVLAYLAVYLPFAIRTTNSTLQQIHDSLEEAARVSGARLLRRLKDVILPLASPGMIAGWILVFMPALRELTVSILLYSHRTETIGVVVYNMQDAGYSEVAAAMACVVIGLIIVGNVGLRRLTGGAGF